MNKVLLWLGILFTALGIVFVAAGGTLALLVAPLLGLAFLGTIARIRRDRTWLQENGRIIEADILGVQYDTRVRVNGRCPLVLQCQAVNPADGKVYVFESDSLWFDPTPFLENRDKMPVLVDPDNYHRYQVLTEDVLPEQG